jgi:hypothetical protein
MAVRIADRLHEIVLADQGDKQMHTYFDIGRPLGLDPDQVRAAIGQGGYNGISFSVTAEDREALFPPALCAVSTATAMAFR